MVNKDYYSLKPQKEDINATIGNNPSYKKQGEEFCSVLKGWENDVRPKMMAVKQGDRPKDLIADWSQSLLDRIMEHSGLVNAYEAYDVLLNYWTDAMQDDCYMVSNDGWTYPEVKAIKRKESIDKKTKTTKVKESACMYDEIVCDLLPVNIVLSEYFMKDKSEIDKLKGTKEQLESDITELQEENEEDFAGCDKDNEIRAAYNAASCKAPVPGEKKILIDLLEMTKNKKQDKEKRDAFIKKHAEIFSGWGKTGVTEIRRRINEIDSYRPLLQETLDVFKKYLDLSDKLASVKSELKEKTIKLTNAVVAKYAELTEDEIRTLVVDKKWLVSVVGGCEALMQTVTHQITTEVTALAERYEETLPSLTANVVKYENEVNGYLKQMGFTL